MKKAHPLWVRFFHALCEGLFSFEVLLLHQEVERHGDHEAAEADENLVEVGLDEQPDADDDGNCRNDGAERDFERDGDTDDVANRMATYGVPKRL